jgi:hypothetical protein
MSQSEAQVQQYIDRHKIQTLVEDAINDAVKQQAEDPAMHMARYLEKACGKAKITKVHARMILDSRGNPTVECDVVTTKGSYRAAVPSGASTGIYEGTSTARAARSAGPPRARARRAPLTRAARRAPPPRPATRDPRSARAARRDQGGVHGEGGEAGRRQHQHDHRPRAPRPRPHFAEGD